MEIIGWVSKGRMSRLNGEVVFSQVIVNGPHCVAAEYNDEVLATVAGGSDKIIKRRNA